ncbi:MAG: hypothetical protein ACXWHB_01735 [Usitatibacter sp.]
MAALLSLLWASSALAEDVYTIQGEFLDTGSNIPRVAVAWPVPINKSYAELTPDQKAKVRDDYVKMGARDEPPYPRDGMMPILREIVRIQNNSEHAGMMHLAVHVDATGQPHGVAVLQSPEEPATKAVTFLLMHTTYKPAICDGAPCAGDYSFKYETQRSHSVHVSLNRPYQLWSEYITH